jgi:DNA-binding MarR family transcriptional regulator
VSGAKRAATEETDLGKIVDFCACIVDLGGPPMASEFVLERAGIALPASAFVLLRLLNSASPLSVSQIAALVGLHPTTVSTQLRPLDEHRYIERRINDRDRRVVWIDITSAGRAANEQVRDVVAGQWRIILERWSGADRHRLAELLDRAREDTQRALREALEDAATELER